MTLLARQFPLRGQSHFFRQLHAGAGTPFGLMMLLLCVVFSDDLGHISSAAVA